MGSTLQKLWTLLRAYSIWDLELIWWVLILISISLLASHILWRCSVGAKPGTFGARVKAMLRRVLGCV